MRRENCTPLHYSPHWPHFTNRIWGNSPEIFLFGPAQLGKSAVWLQISDFLFLYRVQLSSLHTVRGSLLGNEQSLVRAMEENWVSVFHCWRRICHLLLCRETGQGRGGIFFICLHPLAPLSLCSPGWFGTQLMTSQDVIDKIIPRAQTAVRSCQSPDYYLNNYHI